MWVKTQSRCSCPIALPLYLLNGCVSLTRYIFTPRTIESRRTTAVETIESINAGSTMQTWIILAVVDVCRKGIKALNLLQNSSSAALVVPIRIGKSILVVRKSYAALESARSL